MLSAALLPFASDLCGKHRNTVLLRFLPNAPQFDAFFCLGFECAVLSPGVRLLRNKKDGALARKTAQFHGLRRTFGNCRARAGSVLHCCTVHMIEGSAGQVTPRFQSTAVVRLLHSF